MHLLPTPEEVVRVLRETGALRDGHFEYPSGVHSNEYLQVPLAMRYYQHARTLSVGLSRLLRTNSEIRAIIPELSIVAPATGGLPVAYGVCEALRAKQKELVENASQSLAAAYDHSRQRLAVVRENLRKQKVEAVEGLEKQVRLAEEQLEALAKLKPYFKEDGTVTVGNSCSVTDGAAAVILMSGAMPARKRL